MKRLLARIMLLVSTLMLILHPAHIEPTPEPCFEATVTPYSEDNTVLEQEYQEDVVEPTRGTERKLPNVSGAFKTYMDYRTITNTNSTQWYMQQASWTAPNGIRMYGDRYEVAMGTYYSEQCGDKFDITLDTGQVIKVITGDIKSDEHTDANNMYVEHNNNIIEFIVDTDVLSAETQQMGDVSYSGFKGDIVSIVKIMEE